MNFLARLTDLALHRLYTFVLKKLLGPFLKDELVLDQLEVSLLVGRIELSCLQLNPSLLTNYAFALGLGAVEVSSASVSRLSVHIPYSKLLTEEIVFTFEGVNVDLVACTSINYPIALASTLNTSALSGSVIDDSALKGGYAKDMDFVTAWIEQMISTVRIEVKDATINMKGGESGEGGGGSIVLCMKLPSCIFQDETMEHEYTTPPSVYKRISVAPLSVSLASGGGEFVELCRTEGLCSTRLRFCQDVTPLLEVNVGLCQVNFDLYPEAIKEFMELLSAACHCTKHYQGSLSYDDPMRWAYLFGDPFWKSAVSFDEFSGGEGTGRTKQENDVMIDVVTLDEILEMYATARAKLEESVRESTCESVYFDAKDHNASDESQRRALVHGTELRLDGKFAGFNVNVAPSQRWENDCSTCFVINGTHASVSWLQRCQDEKPRVIFKMLSLSLKEKNGESSFTTLLDFIDPSDDVPDRRGYTNGATNPAGGGCADSGSSSSPVVQLTTFTESTSEFMFQPLFISVNVPAYINFLSILFAGFMNVTPAADPRESVGETAAEDNDHNNPEREEVEMLAPAPIAQPPLVDPSSNSPMSACSHCRHRLILKFPRVLLRFPHCCSTSYGDDEDGSSDCRLPAPPRWKDEKNEYIEADLETVISEIYIGDGWVPSPPHRTTTTSMLTVRCDALSASVTVADNKTKFILLGGMPSSLPSGGSNSKFKPCEFVVSRCCPDTSELEEETEAAVSGTDTTIRAWDPVDQGICHSPPNGSGKDHVVHGLIKCSFTAASAAVGISVTGIDIIKRLFADNTRSNDYYCYSEHNPNVEIEAVEHEGSVVPVVFSIDSVTFVLVDDGPEEPDLFAGKAYCATMLSGLSGIFSNRDSSLKLSAADITFMEGDNLQRKRSCSLLEDAVDLAQQRLECALAPVLLHRTQYVALAKEPPPSNVLDVKLECGAERGSILNINLTYITLRHTLPLHWPTRLKSLIVALAGQQLNEGGSPHPSSTPEVHSSPSYATSIYATIHNGVVDYMGDGMRDLGHAVISVGQFRLSATVVARAPTHVAKLIARDAAVYVSNSSSIDGHLGGGGGVLQQYLKQVEEVSSLQDALEHCGFVQIATLDFADVAVTAITGVNVVAELWMGTLRAYTCSDSLAKILGLLSHWWICLQDQIQKQVLAKATKDESTSKATTLGNSNNDDNNNALQPEEGSHLLQDIDAHMFSPRNVSEHIHDRMHRATTTNHQHVGVLDDVQENHSLHVPPLSSSVLIEDFYCLNEAAEEATVKQREVGGDVVKDMESLDQPEARWLSPSTEEEASCDHDEQHDSASSSMSSSPATRDEISMLGSTFNLPCDIDIELEEREVGAAAAPFVPQEGGQQETPQSSISPSRLSSQVGSDSDFEDDDSIVRNYSRWEKQEPCSPSSPLRPVAQWFTPSSDMRIYPHHMPIPQAQEGQPSAEPVNTADGVALSIILYDLNVSFRMFKGCDWPAAAHYTATDKAADSSPIVCEPIECKDDDGLSRGTDRVVDEEEEEISQAELLDALIHNNYREAPPAPDRSSSRTNAALLPSYSDQQRQHHRVEKTSGRITMSMVQVLLQSVNMRLDSYQQLEESPTGEALLSHLALTIKDIHVSDTLASHRLRKTLGHWCDDSEHPRESYENILTLQITTRTPSQRFLQCGKQLGDELRVKIRLLPLHISFAQHTIDFLRDFFTASPETEEEDKAEMARRGKSLDPACISFFQSFDVSACKLLIDYIPRTIQIDALKSGSYIELLNLFPLEGVSLTVDRVLLSGASGVSVALSEALKSWVRDVTQKQMHLFLAGTSIIRPLVHVGQGMMDLVLIPLQQYRKDKKILRGLKGGAVSFCRIVVDEALHTSHRLTGIVARTLDGIVPGCRPGEKRRPLHLQQVDQPKGVCDGLEYAFESLQDTAKDIVTIAIPYEEHEHDAGGGYIRTVVRVLPIAVLRPVVGAAEAVSLILLGFRNAANPQRKRDEEAMWSLPE